jgi:hypothetical protein
MRHNHARSTGRQQGRAVAKRTKALRKATTYRLEPRFQKGLALLGTLTQKPANRMVNEAVGAYLASRTAEVEAELETTLRQVKAYRSADPDYESAIAKFVAAEAELAGEDPAEGETTPEPGPAQRMVRSLLRG